MPGLPTTSATVDCSVNIFSSGLVIDVFALLVVSSAGFIAGLSHTVFSVQHDVWLHIDIAITIARI